MTTIQYPAPTDRTYYLSGPISGDIEGNTRKFAQAVEALRERGFSIVSPVEVCNELTGVLNPEHHLEWSWYMRRDIEALVRDEVEGIIMLPGWEYSKGACLELQIARSLNYYITTLGECLVRPIRVNLETRHGSAAGDGLERPSERLSDDGGSTEDEGTPSTQEVRDASGDVGVALGSHEDRPVLVADRHVQHGGGDGGSGDLG